MFSLYLPDLINSNLTDLIFFQELDLREPIQKMEAMNSKQSNRKGKWLDSRRRLIVSIWCVIASDIISSPMFCIFFSAFTNIHCYTPVFMEWYILSLCRDHGPGFREGVWDTHWDCSHSLGHPRWAEPNQQSPPALRHHQWSVSTFGTHSDLLSPECTS